MPHRGKRGHPGVSLVRCRSHDLRCSDWVKILSAGRETRPLRSIYICRHNRRGRRLRRPAAAAITCVAAIRLKDPSASFHYAQDDSPGSYLKPEAIPQQAKTEARRPLFFTVQFASRSAMVMLSKKLSIMASSLSHMGLVWQQVAREQAAGPWVVQLTAAKDPSVSFSTDPTV